MIAATHADDAIRHRHYSVTWSYDPHNETMCPTELERNHAVAVDARCDAHVGR